MKDIEILFKEGRFSGGALVTVKSWNVEPEKYPRRGYAPDTLLVGVIVGKKVSKRAVERNRLKRQMREVVRLLLKEEKIKTGYMIAVIGKPAMLGKTYQDIEQDIHAVLKKARVLR